MNLCNYFDECLDQESSWKLDTVLAASGGAVTAILGVAGFWSPRRMHEKLKHLDSSKIIASNKYCPSVLIKTSAYSRVQNLHSLVKDIFPTGQVITDTEVLIQACRVDDSSYEPYIFSTKSIDSSSFGSVSIPQLKMSRNMPSANDILGWVAGSFAIPHVIANIPIKSPATPTQPSKTEYYCDGGLTSNSPFPYLKSYIIQSPKKLRITHIIPSATNDFSQLPMLRYMGFLLDARYELELYELEMAFIGRIDDRTDIVAQKRTHGITNANIKTGTCLVAAEWIELVQFLLTLDEYLMFVSPAIPSDEKKYKFNMLNFTHIDIERVLRSETSCKYRIIY